MCELILNRAAFNGDDLVAAFPIETGSCLAIKTPDSKNTLVAVGFDAFTSDDFGGGDLLLSDALVTPVL